MVEATPAAPSPALDLSSFSMAKVTARQKTPGELWLKYLGLPAGVLAFVAIYLMPTPEGLTVAGQHALAIFVLALALWVAEPIPNYVTSLLLMVLLILTGTWEEKLVFGVLGLDVIWLNVTAFILCSVMVKTDLARRLALKLAVRFGRRAMTVLLAFVVLQLILAALIPATAARSVMTLPIMMIIGAIYGSTVDHPSNFGRNLSLLNLQGINIFSSGFLTGSTCNIIAATFIADMANHKVYYTEWLVGALPVVTVAMLASWFIGPRFLFRLHPEEKTPRLAGGLEQLQGELHRMGRMSRAEIQGALIFGVVVFLWVTDKMHMQWFGFEISAVTAALIGAVIALTPRIGLLQWNEADIPWHLLIFSAGAYAGGYALSETGAARWVVDVIFAACGIQPDAPEKLNFWLVYCIVIAVSMFSHIVFTSKTIRTIILIPLVISVAQRLGYDPVALALPAAFTLSWVVTLPISGKPNVIFYGTNQFSLSDNLSSGLVVCAIGTILLILAGLTLYRFTGLIPY